MSSTIQTTGLFSEAAYGPDGMPGQGGVTGAGETHELAWKEALAAAGDAIGSQVGTTAAEIVHQGEVDQGAVGDGLGASGMRDNHPLSWDRLSMTVASMVAWNMQVGLSDDMPDDVIVDASSGVTDSPLMPSLELEGGPFGAGATDSEVGSSPANGVALTSLEQAGATVGFMPSTADKNTNSAGNIVSQEIGKPSLLSDNIQAPTVLREGAETHQSPVVVQGMPTDSSTQEAQASAVRQTGTAFQAQATTAKGAESAVTVPEIPTIPTSSASGTTVTQGTAISPADFEATASPRQGSDGQPDLNAIKQVSSTSAGRAPVEQGIERLTGIRSMLAELDNQAQLRTAVASVQQTTAERDQAARVAAISTLTMTKDKVAQSAEVVQPVTKAQLSGHKARAPGIVGADTSGAGDRTFGSTGDGFGEFTGLSEKRVTPEAQLRDQRMPVGRALQQDVQMSSSAAESNAAFIGTENVEISADQDTMIQSAEAAAETIEASEVPELPINDPSQIDFDVDDPAGTVRVSMTREAEEVAVRLETPNEVLEEYREMRGEMDEAIAKQGLDLSEFSASAHGEAGDTEADSASDRVSQEESSRGEINQDVRGQQNLEQSGDTARLVNHIV